MATERKTGMDYPEYKTPKSVEKCLKAWDTCRAYRKARLEVQHKMLDKNGKLRK